MLKNPADRRVVAYMIVTTALLVVQWQLSSFQPVLVLWSCFMGVAASVIAHNHTHVPMWRSGWMNRLQDYWITLAYGFPVFAWTPTHNRNHHRYTNRPGDETATWRYSERNNLITMLTYPTISGLSQQKTIRDFLAQQWRNNRKRFWFCVSQYALLIAFVGGALWLDWRKALVLIVLPQQVGLFSVLVFNYVQHVHADEESEWNASRNIVGPVLNAMLFNNGFHTVHHMKPTMHWSEAPAAHAAIAHHIDPSLNEPSFWGMMFRWYVKGLFVPSARSTSMRLARMAREQDVAA